MTQFFVRQNHSFNLSNAVGFGVITLLFFLLLSASCLAAGLNSGKQVSLGELIKTTLKNNQELSAADATAQRYNSRISMLRKFDDSIIADQIIALYYLEFPLFEVERPEQRLGENWAFETERRYQNRLDMVKNLALWYQLLSQELRLELTQQVKEQYYRLYFHDLITAAEEENLQTIAKLVQTSQDLYAVGQLRQTDIIKLQTEQAKQRAKIIELNQKRIERVANLNYLAARQPGQPIVPVVEPDITPATLPDTNQNLRTMLDGVVTARPMFKAYRAIENRFHINRLMVQGYISADAVFEADNGKKSIVSKSGDFYNQVTADIEVAHAALHKNGQLAKLYDEVILPQARQNLQSSLAQLRVGQQGVRKTLQNILTLNRYQVTVFEIQADYMAELTKLENLSGMSLFGPVL